MELLVDEDVDVELSGDENLAEILEKFRLERSPRVDEGGNLPALDEYYRKEVANQQVDLEKTARDILLAMVLPYAKDDMQEALKNIVDQYVDLEFGLRYDKIHPGLFGMEREIIMPGDRFSPAYKVEIPLFASVKLGEKSWRLKKRVELTDDREVDVDIESRTPPLSRYAFERVRHCQADYLNSLAYMLRSTVIGSMELGVFGKRLDDLKFKMYWIPKDSELKIRVERVDPDPFIAAELNGNHYLIARWDVKGEKPYQHYLAEFTEERSG